jgi:hypothetical protein
MGVLETAAVDAAAVALGVKVVPVSHGFKAFAIP